jgi:hypothetical protein
MTAPRAEKREKSFRPIWTERSWGFAPVTSRSRFRPIVTADGRQRQPNHVPGGVWGKAGVWVLSVPR